VPFSRLCLLLTLVTTVTDVLGVTLPSDAKPFTRAQLYQYLAEKTQIRKDGGTFHSDAGTLVILKKGKRYRGSWSTHDEGMLCWHVYDWGEALCEHYYHTAEGVKIVGDGVVLDAPEHQAGDTLKLLESRSGLFSKADTVAFLSGNTVILGPGQGLYYGPDFTLIKIWNGVTGLGHWTVTDEGAVCWHIPGWGPTPCESYYYADNDNLMSIYLGKHRKAAKHVQGNQLDSLSSTSGSTLSATTERE